MKKYLIQIGCILVFISSCHPTVRESKTSVQATKMDSVKIEMAEDIKDLITSGFYNKEETIDEIKDIFYNEPLDESWINEMAEKEYNKRLAEQSSWPAVTDFDKLARVFDQLNTSGIIALHKAGNTRQDGEEDTREMHQELAGKGIKTTGYCFYHTQDMDRAIDSHHLFLAFGDFINNDQQGAEIGKKIVELLHQSGFATKWDNSIETRIEILNINWLKRFGNENCSYEHAKKLLAKNK